jgi:hypothetical protein
MSLVENLARRHHSPLELMRQIGTLRDGAVEDAWKRGYSATEIAAKTDFSDEYVSAICFLLDHGEERLLAGIERGLIPTSVAMEIVRAKDGDMQEALAEAYEKKAIPGNQILAIRRMVELRNVKGKGMDRTASRVPSQPASGPAVSEVQYTLNRGAEIGDNLIQQSPYLPLLDAARWRERRGRSPEHLLGRPFPFVERDRVLGIDSDVVAAVAFSRNGNP